jgi:2-haloacid dehalogenase
MKAELHGVRAIVFDTFGTVVDWRESIIRDLGAWGETEGVHGDWTRLADLWRGQYEPQKDRVRRGDIPWTNFDDLHYEALEGLLPQLGLSHLSKEQRRHISRVWHRLEAWPDAVAGLERLKKRYILGPLSNGNIALLVNMAKHAGLPWDSIFSAEHFQHYKPHPDTYLGVCRQLDLQPAQVMMCAAHNYDLRAARALGLRTGFIPRPLEYGPGQTADLVAEEDWDVVAADMNEFAARMGA